MKLLTNLIVHLAQLLVKNVLVMKFVQNVILITTCTMKVVQHHAQMVITEQLTIIHAKIVTTLVQPVVVNTITVVSHVPPDIS